jgi:hypothetical protein
MKVLKTAFVIACVVGASFRCAALEIKFDNYVVAKEPDKACYLVETIMYSVDEYGIKYVIGRSQVWMGDCTCLVVPISNPGCPAVPIDGLLVYTSVNSPACIASVLNNPEMVSAYRQSLNGFMAAHKSVPALGVKPVVNPLRAYPNPAGASINIETAITDFKGPVWIKIHDVNGHEVYNGYLNNPASGFIKVSTNALYCGQYIISVGDDEWKIDAQKVVVHK